MKLAALLPLVTLGLVAAAPAPEKRASGGMCS
jgi:hypothetical protein